MTVKPATASSPMNVNPIVASSSTASAWLRCCWAEVAPDELMLCTVPAGGW